MFKIPSFYRKLNTYGIYFLSTVIFSTMAYAVVLI